MLICQHQREICSHSLEMLPSPGANIQSMKWILALHHIPGKPTLDSSEPSFNYDCCGLPLCFQSGNLITPEIQFFTGDTEMDSLPRFSEHGRNIWNASQTLVDSEDIGGCAVGAGFSLLYVSCRSYPLFHVLQWIFLLH